MAHQSVDESAAATRRRITARAEPLVATVQVAAVMCSLSERKIKELVATRELRSVRAGGRRLIFVDSIHELLGIKGLVRPSEVDRSHAP